MAKKLKLYVWEKCLQDYGYGVMFAYAESVDQARELLGKKIGWNKEDLIKEPKEVNEPYGYYVYGSS